MKTQDLLQLVDQPAEIRLNGFSELMLNHLMQVAQQALAAIPEKHPMLQVTALYTAGEKIYTGISYGPNSGDSLIEGLKQHGDTQVTHLVSLWQQGGLDVPSFDFRKALLELDAKNEFALLLMQGHDCLRARTVGSSMPPRKTEE